MILGVAIDPGCYWKSPGVCAVWKKSVYSVGRDLQTVTHSLTMGQFLPHILYCALSSAYLWLSFMFL